MSDQVVSDRTEADCVKIPDHYITDPTHPDGRRLMTREEVLDMIEPVWDWFELSYAQYLTIPRSIMQAMPVEWQLRMVQCLEELDETFAWRPEEGRYWVQLKDGRGRYTHDPLMEYRHPDQEYIESIRNAEGAKEGGESVG